MEIDGRLLERARDRNIERAHRVRHSAIGHLFGIAGTGIGIAGGAYELLRGDYVGGAIVMSLVAIALGSISLSGISEVNLARELQTTAHPFDELLTVIQEVPEQDPGTPE